jgi:predicted nucleotidyltransferase
MIELGQPVPAEVEARLDVLSRRLAADARVAACWLFGSRARGEADGLSDVDVAVLAAGSRAARRRRRGAIAMTVDRDVVIARIARIRDELRHLEPGYPSFRGPPVSRMKASSAHGIAAATSTQPAALPVP